MTPEEFAPALEALTAGAFPADQQEQFENHLRNDPDTVRAYVEQMRLHALLGWRKGAILPVESRTSKSRAWKWAAAFAAIAAAILFAVNFFQPTRNPGHPPEVVQRPSADPILPPLVQLPPEMIEPEGVFVDVDIPGRTRVACLGDSITAGSGYVTELQKWMGQTHAVRNFGVSGATLLAKGDKPYAEEKAYKDAIEFKPEIVTLMLGTNDTKPQNFKHVKDFATDTKVLLEPFLKMEKPPKIYLCLPVPVYFEGNFGIDNGRLNEGIIPAIKAVAKELSLPVIDVNSPLQNRPDLFHKDNVHPLGGGANLAAPIYETLIARKPPTFIPPAPPRTLRLACLGDSITEGSGYPAAMQQSLGNRFMVKNYGVSSSTLLSKGDKPYTKQAKYAQALEFQPDAVILMLGTNDTKPQNYKTIGDFAKELGEMCDEIAGWKSKPRVLLALPAPVIGEGNFGIDNKRLEEGVLPAIRALAKEKKLPLIDMNAALKPFPELFKDRIHPTGAQGIMAKAALEPLLAAFPLPPVKANLLDNGGAEEGARGWGTRGGKLEIVTDPVKAGKAAFKTTGRKAGFHAPSQNVTAAVKDLGMGYYQLRGSVRLAAGSADAVLLVIISDANGMRYCKTPARTANAEGWVDFADDVYLGWTGDLKGAIFCIETNGAMDTDLLADELSLARSVEAK